MEPTLIAQYIARVTGVSIAATGRPLLTLWLTQLAMRIAHDAGWVTLQPSFAWVVSTGVIAGGLLLVLVEIVVEHVGIVEQLARELYIDRVLRGGGTLAAALVVSAMGARIDPSVVAPPDAALIDPEVVAVVGGTTRPWWLVALAVAGAVAVNQGLCRARAAVLEHLGEVDLAGLFKIVEAGGVVACIVIFAILPVPALALVLVIGGVLAAGAALARAVAAV